MLMCLLLGGGGFFDMMFFQSFMPNTRKCWPRSEVVLESLPDSDNFNYFIFYKKKHTNVQKRHQEI